MHYLLFLVLFWFDNLYILENIHYTCQGSQQIVLHSQLLTCSKYVDLTEEVERDQKLDFILNMQQRFVGKIGQPLQSILI